MIGVGSLVWCQPTNINGVGDGTHVEANGAIRIDLQYGVRAGIRALIFIFSAGAQHDLVPNVIGMGNARGIFAHVVFVNNSLFLEAYIFPIGGVL